MVLEQSPQANHQLELGNMDDEPKEAPILTKTPIHTNPIRLADHREETIVTRYLA